MEQANSSAVANLYKTICVKRQKKSLVLQDLKADERFHHLLLKWEHEESAWLRSPLIILLKKVIILLMSGLC